jgi:hypothetical protein
MCRGRPFLGPSLLTVDPSPGRLRRPWVIALSSARCLRCPSKTSAGQSPTLRTIRRQCLCHRLMLRQVR